MARFNDVISTREQFRSIMGEPSDLVTRKSLSALDRHCGVFIGKAPFLLIASADADGHTDVSPKGDPIGFIKILDENTLVIPDRLGNRRADTIENILQNPNVGLIFLIPGKTETLRVSGKAEVVKDAALLQSMAVGGKSPDFAIVVTVQEAFFHCSKCMIRSKLWETDHWPDLNGLPRLAQTMVDAGKLELTENEMHDIVVNDEKVRLY
ncbi:pyridoxamine 5'-phosphate oxidase family protein [Congregibacter variabilis]|uniref:Pyridoxamine 5'-phosphate oxidase family protein n=1 Tax=Congregibacter variabilis TaxID=3081200 RepID=A0ABZ0I5E3_9GAMM|nr:pyridoxamine 5'-phosphate oxidase family protein [Congregibacter sp. IMCC43200]